MKTEKIRLARMAIFAETSNETIVLSNNNQLSLKIEPMQTKTIVIPRTIRTATPRTNFVTDAPRRTPGIDVDRIANAIGTTTSPFT